MPPAPKGVSRMVRKTVLAPIPPSLSTSSRRTLNTRKPITKVFGQKAAAVEREQAQEQAKLDLEGMLIQYYIIHNHQHRKRYRRGSKTRSR